MVLTSWVQGLRLQHEYLYSCCLRTTCIPVHAVYPSLYLAPVQGSARADLTLPRTRIGCRGHQSHPQSRPSTSAKLGDMPTAYGKPLMVTDVLYQHT